MEDKGNRPVLSVQLFGEFNIQYGERELTGNIGRSKKVWALIEYLLSNRGKEISQERLVDDLWPEAEYDNPFSILKNLVYRARIALKTLCDDSDVEFIVYENNCYTWNMNQPCVVDVEEFEKYWKLAKAAGDGKDKTAYAQLAFNQYSGEFLPGLSFYSWVISKNAYYANEYSQCARYLAEQLLDNGQFSEAIRVCSLAVGHHPFEEELHRLLLTAYAGNDQFKQAVEHYQQISDQFYNEFGVTLSTKTKSLYKEIIKSLHYVEIDLATIKEDLTEVTHLPGAYFCEYEILKNIYRINARLMIRNGFAIHVGLITVTDEDGDIPSTDVLKPTMDRLQSYVVTNLRRGDAVAKYSATQLVMMLPQTTRSNGCLVLDRLLAGYRRRYPVGHVRLQYRMEPVDPLT